MPCRVTILRSSRACVMCGPWGDFLARGSASTMVDTRNSRYFQICVRLQTIYLPLSCQTKFSGKSLSGSLFVVYISIWIDYWTRLRIPLALSTSILSGWLGHLFLLLKRLDPWLCSLPLMSEFYEQSSYVNIFWYFTFSSISSNFFSVCCWTCFCHAWKHSMDVRWHVFISFLLILMLSW